MEADDDRRQGYVMKMLTTSNHSVGTEPNKNLNSLKLQDNTLKLKDNTLANALRNNHI